MVISLRRQTVDAIVYDDLLLSSFTEHVQFDCETSSETVLHEEHRTMVQQSLFSTVLYICSIVDSATGGEKEM